MRWSRPSARKASTKRARQSSPTEDSLSWSRTEDSLPLPLDEENERPSQGYQLNENKKDVKTEPEQPNPDASYVFIPSKPYAHPPIMDQMPTDQRIALISDAVNCLAGNTDPASQEMLHDMLEAAHNLKSSKSASSSKPAQPAQPAYLANFEDAPPADAAMEDAAEDSPAEIAEAKSTSRKVGSTTTSATST